MGCRLLIARFKNFSVKLSPGETGTLGDFWEITFEEDGVSCVFKSLQPEMLSVPTFWMV